MTGTGTINKLVNLFAVTVPRLFIKTGRYMYSKALRKKLPRYQDPWWLQGNFKILKFNYFPFEWLKRRFLIFQINYKFRILKRQDRAFEKYGM